VDTSAAGPTDHSLVPSELLLPGSPLWRHKSHQVPVQPKAGDVDWEALTQASRRYARDPLGAEVQRYFL
jgi:hypothetical protein